MRVIDNELCGAHCDIQFGVKCSFKKLNFKKQKSILKTYQP